MSDFESTIDDFKKRNIQIIAASVDSRKHAQKTVERYKLSFKVGYGLDAKEVSSKTGAFYDAKDGYLHATGYIINPQAEVVNGVYSTLAIGRLVPKDCIGLIDHFSRR